MKRQKRNLLPAAVPLALVAALAAAAAGCGGGGGTGSLGFPEGLGTSLEEIRKQAGTEGRLNLVYLAGYVEDGSTDPRVDWVSEFEQTTGCHVDARIGNTSDEIVTLMRTGNYDSVSAPGDASLRLITGGDVAAVDTQLIPNYDDLFDGLKQLPHNTVGDLTYGVPHGRAANVLMWRTDKVKPAPASWRVVWDENSPYRGRVTAYDSPLTIADAALYLKAARPELGIENVYELDDRQFRAAIGLLKRQRALIGAYWSDSAKEIAAFESGSTVVGASWQVTANLLRAETPPVPVGTTLPQEGSTGWSDTWLVYARARNPNCAYLWLDWIISPQTNASVSEWFGQAPANAKACELTVDDRHCDTYHAADEEYFAKVAYWTAPQKRCGDARGDVCKDYSEWVAAWKELRG